MAKKKPTKVVNRLVVIGLGLIGSSLAVSVRNKGLANEVIGISRRQSTLEIALNNGIVDRCADDLSQVADELEKGDIVVIGVPTFSVTQVLEECISKLSPDVTITDVASVKESVVNSAKDLFGSVPPQLVPGHPIAGSEKSGVTAANPDLFVDHRVILTPVETTADSHLERTTKLWKSVGAIVSSMDVQEHDQILAATSHLPHLIAYNIVGTAAQLESDTRSDVIKYSASGFRDFTRIASSDPIMWRDIFMQNKDAVLEMLGRFSEDLTALQRAIRHGDGAHLEKVFTTTRAIRKSVVEAGQDTDEPNFGRDKKAD